ncbi:MAG: carboxypeptidase regulatory-like domain-containing protein [Candidatus Hydrogenedentes bacterium]|nr:carboxypeptidase regulatory-like domain-containing protein [Candidatus Hydrogenedentota bacterium]
MKLGIGGGPTMALSGGLAAALLAHPVALLTSTAVVAAIGLLVWLRTAPTPEIDGGAANVAGTLEASAAPQPAEHPAVPRNLATPASGDVALAASPEAAPAQKPGGPARGAWIYGWALDSRGAAVAQTQVNIWDATPEGSAGVVADDQGYFEFESVLPAAQCYVNAFAPKARSTQTLLEDIRAGQSREVRLVIHTNKVRGRAVDTAGTVLPGTNVLAGPRIPYKGGLPTAMTDRAGEFVLEGLFPDTYDFSLQLPGEEWQKTGVSLEVSGDSDHSGLLLVLPDPGECQISGYVTAETGAPIAEARVSAHLPIAPYTSRWARTDSAGWYCITGLDEGVYILQLAHAEYGNGFRRDVALGGGDENFTLAPRGTVAGQVLDATTRQPVRKFEVLERLPSSSDDPGMYSEQWHEVESAEGRFVLERLVPGEAAVEVRAAGYAQSKQMVEVPPGAVREDVVVMLERDREISGIVVDAAGAPVPGTALFAGPLPYEYERDQKACAHAAGDGTFVLRGCAAGAEVISAYHHAYAPAQAPMPADQGPVRIVLNEGARASGVVYLDGAPLEGASVGVFILGLYVGPSGSARTGADGSYTLEKMPEGNAMLNVSIDWNGKNGGREQAVELELRSGQVVKRDFHFATWNTALRGHALANDKPAPGLFFSAFTMLADGTRETFDGHTTMEGEYALAGLPPGPCTIAVFPPGAQGMEETVKEVVVIVEGEEVERDVAWAE